MSSSLPRKSTPVSPHESRRHHPRLGSHPHLRQRAAERLPIETWHRILLLAIVCALLPREEDDYAGRTMTRDLDCRLIAEYKASERVRTNLRLVCWRWSTFLEEHSDRLVHFTPSVPEGFWPPVKRWDHVVRLQGPQNVFCGCEESCWPPFDRRGDVLMSGGLFLPVAIGMEEKVRSEYLPQLSSRCRAIIWPGVWRNDLVDPERFGGVTMMAQNFEDREQAAMQSGVITRVFIRLISLELWITSFVNPAFNIELPHLQFLRIFTQKQEASALDYPDVLDIGHWTLPRLTSCTIWTVAWTEDEVSAFNVFLQQVGKSLVEIYICDMTESARDAHAVFSAVTWEWLPCLRILGTNLKQLLLMITPPKKREGPPLELLIDPEANLLDHLPPEELVTELGQKWADCSVGRVVINERWEAMAMAIKEGETWVGEGLAGRGLKILDMLDAIGTGLWDSEGVPFGEAVRRQLQEVLLATREGGEDTWSVLNLSPHSLDPLTLHVQTVPR